MTAAARRRRREGDEPLDTDLLDLPPAARWREWMLRVEAAIFASAKPVPRGAGPSGRPGLPVRRFDRRSHPRTARPPVRLDPCRRRLCAAHQNPLRAGDPRRPSRTGRGCDWGAHQGRTFALTAIAYLQPVTRGEISKLAGREISRDVIASLKRHGLIDGAIRAPQPGAPFAYVTTRKFLDAFGFASLRDLPDIDRLKSERPPQAAEGEAELDGALGLFDEEDAALQDKGRAGRCW
jgi:segregation and condensation protein B